MDVGRRKVRNKNTIITPKSCHEFFNRTFFEFNCLWVSFLCPHLWISLRIKLNGNVIACGRNHQSRSPPPQAFVWKLFISVGEPQVLKFQKEAWLHSMPFSDASSYLKCLNSLSSCGGFWRWHFSAPSYMPLSHSAVTLGAPHGSLGLSWK